MYLISLRLRTFSGTFIANSFRVATAEWPRHAGTTRAFTLNPLRRIEAPPENVNVIHSRFLAEGTSQDKWRSGPDRPAAGTTDPLADETDSLSDGKGN